LILTPTANLPEGTKVKSLTEGFEKRSDSQNQFVEKQNLQEKSVMGSTQSTSATVK
jgi:hypothetical protein